MADFNLLAEINVQLAKDAGATLSKELKALSVGPITVKVTGDLSGLKADIAALSGGKHVIDIGLAKNTLSNVQKLKKDLESLLKTVQKFGGNLSAIQTAQLLTNSSAIGAGGAGTVTIGGKQFNVGAQATSGSNKATNAAKKTKKAVQDTVGDLNKLEARLKSLNGQANKGEFFPFLNQQLKDLISSYTKLGSVGSAGRKNLLEAFGGLGEKNNIKNLVSATEEVFKQINKLDSKRANLSSKGLLGPDIEREIDSARQSILGLLKTLDASNSASFRSILDEQVKRASSRINDLNNEAINYRKILKSIATEEANAIQTGADPAVVKQLREKLKVAQDLRAQGVRTADIQSNPTFLDAGGLTANAQRASKTSQTILKRFDGILAKVSAGGAYATAGARAVELTQRVTDLINSSRAEIESALKINDSTLNNRLNSISGNFDAKFKNLTETAKDINSILRNISGKESYYNADGLKQTSAQLSVVRAEIDRLIKVGAPTNQITDYFDRQSQAVELLSSKEQKLRRIVQGIERLRTSLEFNISGGDRAGVGGTLDKVRKTVENTDVRSFDESALKQEVSRESFRARYQAKLNKEIQSASDNFNEQIFNVDETSKVGKAWRAGANEFVNLVSKLDLSDTSFEGLRKNLFLVKEANDLAFSRAATEAAGGFFATIAKAGLLAAKRLSVFLVAAQGLYAVQNVITGAINSVIQLDSNFVRLEQIFAGSSQITGTVEDNVDRLSSKILELGRNYGVAAEQIAESADILAQADIRGPDLDKILTIATKARLGPTFKSNVEVTEAVIAAMNQFELQAGDMEDVIGGISQVSAQFAVESEGVTAAIRRAGGAFAAGRGAQIGYKEGLANFIGLFTVLKQETREADETLATALRNILNRLQRTNVQDYLRKQFDIDFLDDDRQFIGPLAALEKVQERIKELNLQTTDPRFAEIVQKLAGSLQSSRLNSLLKGLSETRRVTEEFNKGGDILDRDADLAFGKIENKLERAKNAVIELFTEIGRSQAVKALIELFTTMTIALTGLVRQLDLVTIGLVGLASTGAIKSVLAGIVSSIREFALIGPGLVTKRFLDNRVANFGSRMARGVGGLKSGGLVPGDGPNIDTEPYMLARGEYVVNKYSVRRYGKGFFDQLNAGKIKYAVTGSGSGGLLSDSGGSIESVRSLIKNNTIELVDLLREFGVEIENITDVIDGVVDIVSPENMEKRFGSATARGMTSTKLGQKSKLYLNENLFNSKNFDQLKATTYHEIGHGLDRGVSQSRRLEDISIPSANKASTVSRLKRNKRYDESNIGPELIADFFSNAVRKESDPSTRGQNPAYSGLLNTVGQRGFPINFLGGSTPRGASIFPSTSSGGGFSGPPRPPRPPISSDPPDGPNDDWLKKIREFFKKLENTGFKINDAVNSFDNNITERISKLNDIPFINKVGSKVGSASAVISGAINSPSSAVREIGSAARRAGSSIGFGSNSGIVTSSLKSVGRTGLAVGSGIAQFGSNIFKEVAPKLKTFQGSVVGVTAALFALGLIANSSKGANDNLLKFISALSAATIAVIGYTQAQSGARRISEYIGGKLPESIKKRFRSPLEVDIPLKDTFNAFEGLLPAGPYTNKARASILQRAEDRVKANKLFGVVDRTKVAGYADRAFDVGSKLKPVGTGAAKVAAGFTKLASILGLVGTVVTSVFNSFADSGIAAQNKIIESTTDEQEARSALNRRRQLQGAQRGSSLVGAVSAGAGIGAAVGGPIGAVIGAIAGFLYGTADHIKTILDRTGITAVGKAIASFGTTIFNGLASFFGAIDSFLYSLKDETEKLADRRKNETEEAVLSASANIKFFNKNQGKGGNIAQNQLIRGASQLATATISDENDFNLIKGEAENLKKTIEGLSEFQKAGILQKAKESGTDIVALFEKLDIEFDAVGAASTAALSEISATFLRMKTVNKQFSDQLTSFDAENQVIGNVAAGIAGDGSRAGQIPTELIDIMRSGGAVSGTGAQMLDQAISNLRSINREAAGNFVASSAGARATNNIVSDIAFRGLKLSGEGGTDALKNTLSDRFEKETGGLPPDTRKKLNSVFDGYLNSIEDQLSGAVSGNEIDASKVADALNGFADSIDNGSSDLLKKFIESNSKFQEGLNTITKQRLEFENKNTELLINNIGKQKSLFDIQNKGRGLTGQRLTNAEGFQASVIDFDRQAARLAGTGLGGGASVQDIRGRIGQLTASDPLSQNPVTQNLKNNLTEALQQVASGTDSFAQAMSAFDKAAEKAKRTTEEFTGVLLGTDEDMISTVKGLTAYQDIISSQNAGQGFLKLQNLDEGTRSSINKLIGGDEDKRATFNQALGIGTDISNIPEAKAAKDAVAQQIEANNALISVNNVVANNLNVMAAALISNKDAFEQFGVQTNNFAAQAANLAQSLTNIPQNITHTHTFSVSPIQVSFTGAEAIGALTPSMQEATIAIVNSKLASFANNLKQQNKGLTIDALALNGATA